MSDQAPPPEVVQGDTAAGPGGPTPLPYGEATQLNQDLAAAAQADQAQQEAPVVPGEAAPTAPPEQQQPEPALDQGPVPNFTPTTDEEKYLFAPTDKPHEPVTMGLLQSGQVAPPPGIRDWLPALQAAASDPTAPESTRLILAFVTNEMG